MNDRERLEQIIDLETPVAEAGCLTAQSLVINAMSELDDLNEREIALRRTHQCEEDFYSSMHEDPPFDPYDNELMGRWD